MNLFVCGSRTISDKEWIFSQIEACIAEQDFTDITILEGEAKGVDTIAKEWAVSHGIPVKEYPPDYNPENTSFKERCNAFYLFYLNSLKLIFQRYWLTKIKAVRVTF